MYYLLWIERIASYICCLTLFVFSLFCRFWVNITGLNTWRRILFLVSVFVDFHWIMTSDFSQCLNFIHISGSSSIGSVDARFLAAFAAAAGKKSVQSFDSEESDPDWGCWSTSQELRKPSIKIIYPTMERVKNASCGILASRYLLCFSQVYWLYT